MTYNGWPNYPTWNAYLWLSNNEKAFHKTERLAYEIYRGAHASHSYGLDGEAISETAVHNLSGYLKEYFEVNAPKLTGMYADLLGYALGEIDCRCLADHFLQELGRDGTGYVRRPEYVSGL